MSTTFKTIAAVAGFLMGLVAQGWAQNLSMPSYLGRAGTDVTVPLEIDAAAGLATIRAKVNFDRNILELTDVRAGPLGSQFGLVWESDDGVLDIFMARDEALVSGTGRLVLMTFRVNEGAQTNLYSDLALADYVPGDDSGVVALKRLCPVSGTGGRLTVTDGTTIDNAGNGLPDEWELANGLDPFSATADGDEDGDGVSNALEAQLGLNPNNADTDGDGYPDWSEYVAGTSGIDDTDFLALCQNQPEETFSKVLSWSTVIGRIYSLQNTTNILDPWPGTSIYEVHGDGTEKSFTNNSWGETWYYRLKVEME